MSSPAPSPLPPAAVGRGLRNASLLAGLTSLACWAPRDSWVPRDNSSAPTPTSSAMTPMPAPAPAASSPTDGDQRGAGRRGGPASSPAPKIAKRPLPVQPGALPTPPDAALLKRPVANAHDAATARVAVRSKFRPAAAGTKLGDLGAIRFPENTRATNNSMLSVFAAGVKSSHTNALTIVYLDTRHVESLFNPPAGSVVPCQTDADCQPPLGCWWGTCRWAAEVRNYADTVLTNPAGANRVIATDLLRSSVVQGLLATPLLDPSTPADKELAWADAVRTTRLDRGALPWETKTPVQHCVDYDCNQAVLDGSTCPQCHRPCHVHCRVICGWCQMDLCVVCEVDHDFDGCPNYPSPWDTDTDTDTEPPDEPF